MSGKRTRFLFAVLFVAVSAAVPVLRAQRPQSPVTPANPDTQAARQIVSSVDLTPDAQSDEVWPGLKLHTLRNGQKLVQGGHEDHMTRGDGSYYRHQHNDSVFVDWQNLRYRVFHRETPSDDQRLVAYLTSQYGVSPEAARQTLTVQPMVVPGSYSDYSYTKGRRVGPRRMSTRAIGKPGMRKITAILQDGGGYGWECRGYAYASLVTRDGLPYLEIPGLHLTSTTSGADAVEGEQCDYYSGYCEDWWYGDWSDSWAAAQPSSAGTNWYVDWGTTYADGSSSDWSSSNAEMHAYYYNYDFNDFVFRLSAGLVTLPQLFTEVANHTFATAWAGSGYKTEYGEQISGYAYLLHFDPSEYSDGYCFSW